jgi:uncharacterized repeat protein (TIGR03803 family)
MWKRKRPLSAIRPMLACMGVALGVIARPAPAQTYSVIHDFTGGSDGANPIAGITVDSSGSLAGTASSAGGGGYGDVFRMVHVGAGWRFDLLYTFLGNFENDGERPYARVVIGPDGALYGTTFGGGNGQGCPERYGCGIVFRISAKDRASLDPWQETVLFRFGYANGSNPGYGDLQFDSQGNLYGTTQNGGVNLQGTVYELARNGTGWTENVLYSFAGPPDGGAPLGGTNGGTVYQLHPSSTGWIESVLYSFQNSSGGVDPGGNLAMLSSGALFGATQSGATNNGGAFFELNPALGGNWDFSVLFDFDGPSGGGTYRTLMADGVGNFYGTTSNDGPDQQGSVFKLISANGIWTYTTLHSFTGGMDGGMPFGTLSLDSHGNLYGTASTGGAYGDGVVFEITP